MLTRTFFSRAPLMPQRFAPLPAGAVTVRAQARERLIALRGGLLSRCESLFPHSGSASCWFGGTMAGGADAAHVLEASLLTAALLGDEELRRQALRLADAVVDGQREDGSFGAEDETFAARGRMLRAIKTAYTMTGSKAQYLFMLRYMKYLSETLSQSPLSSDDALHTADTLECGVFLYNLSGQKAILSVLSTLVSQGADYTSLLHAFPYRAPVARVMSDEALRAALEGENEDGYAHHLLRYANAAHLCEGLRASALCGVLTGSGKHLSAAETGLSRMNHLHGAVCGGVTGDPLLAGTHPSRGVDALSLCELAASLETLLACPDGDFAADQLDRVMYNGIAAAFASDGRSVQRMQQANQVCISREARFPLSAKNASLFSLEDGEALCALLSAWPRYYAASWLLSRDGGLYAASYAPCQVRYRLDGVSVRLTVDSGYPVSSAVRITLSLDQSAAFPLHLHIPAWAKGASAAVGGDILPAQAGTLLTLNRQWNDGDVILLTLPMTAEFVPGFHDCVSVQRGPLVYALVPAYDESVHADGTKALCARAGFGAALVLSAGPETIESESGVTVRAKAVSAPGWGMRGASCDQPPFMTGSQAEDSFDAVLVSYADAPVRLSVFPTV